MRHDSILERVDDIVARLSGFAGMDPRWLTNARWIADSVP